MDQTIQLYSISELLEMKFFIPSYQRGYRWTQRQVTDLLDDIYGFATRKKIGEKEFYCLQPIVVREHEWTRTNGGHEETHKGWELVDGQQRLTTLRILFTYLVQEHLKGETLKREYGKDIFTLDYETRENTEGIMAGIAGGNDDNIDFYHIAETYKFITEWFTEQDGLRDVREAILRTLVYDIKKQKNEGVVQVIWYQIGENDNPIETFIRINMGKISLTNAELIKALFLQERNFGSDDMAKLRQLEIAGEWDRIENTLQNDEFWGFLNNEKSTKASRIEFILDIACLVARKKDPLLSGKIGDDHYATFRYFYNAFEQQSGFTFLKAQWSEIIGYFQSFSEWYENPIWYHYIGFLIYNGVDILTILELTNKKSATKSSITKELMDMISDRFKNVRWAVPENENPYLNLSYSKNKGIVKELLLLFNLQYIIEQCKNENLIYKFPFKAFRKQDWDVEHIDSYTDNALNDAASQKDWLIASLTDIPQLDETLIERINTYLNGTSTENFELLQSEVIAIAGEELNDEELKDNIGNLTLLDKGTNRAYGNALFVSKRRTIIVKDKQGVFIPLGTKNVFLKYFDLQGHSRTKWGREDIVSYRNIISEALTEFLPAITKTAAVHEQI